MMNWIKNHGDAIVTILTTLTSIFGGFLWINGKFNETDKKIYEVKADFDTKFASLDKEIAIIKTVLIMKEVMPKELAVNKNIE